MSEHAQTDVPPDEVAPPSAPEIATNPGTEPAAEAVSGPETTAARRSGRADGKGGANRSLWREIPVLVLLAVGLALLIKTFFLQAFYIPSGSMERTLAINDRVLVNKLVYDFRDPHRGEIVVFNGAGTNFRNESRVSQPSSPVGKALRRVQSFLGLGSYNESDFIKRVIAVAGDTVECPVSTKNPSACDAVLVNGHPLDESSYLYENSGYVPPEQATFPPHTVGRGQLWVMGDHRDNSDDSRPNGTIPVSAVVGRAFVTVWPVSHFSGHPVPGTFDGQPLAPKAEGLPLGARLLTGTGTPPALGVALALPAVGLRGPRQRHQRHQRHQRR